MKKTIIVYGLFSGFIVTGLMFATMPLWNDGTISFESGELVGYASMVVSLSLIFFGVKSYRDNYEEGVISFRNALKVGVLIALVASVVYVVGWEIYFQSTGNEFMEQYSHYYIEKMQKSGASLEKIETTRQDMANMKELYKNPIMRYGITLAEIFPVGALIALLSAAILKKNK